MFRYNYTGSFISRLMNVVDIPLQVELQPGINCGEYHCPYCYGKGQKLNEGLLSLSDYETLLSDLKSKPQFLALGGIASDPLTYSHFAGLLELVIGKGFKFGISTKGHFLNDEIIHVLSNSLNDDCFINFSVDASNNQIYNQMRSVKSGQNYYDLVRKNINKLNEECKRKKSKLRIKVSYLLFTINAGEKKIDKFIDDFYKIVDEIRFSIPQYPNEAQAKGFLDEREIDRIFQILNKYNDDKITILPFNKSEHDRSFDKCVAQRFNITIDKAGYVYPCPQVTTKNYSQLILGNIKNESIWNIWNSQKRHSMFEYNVDTEMKCRVCDRKDEIINIDINKILSSIR
ncbi:MAG: radical SAM protein [Armatimonadetes bacterium]|nr:radical SAM protein [Armatimonadota bacterium]